MPDPVSSLIRKLGPGLITGASKNDPASITTYAKIGAQIGYPILWTMVFSYPILAGIQEVSAMIGRATGRGIAGNIRRYYPGWVLYLAVLLLVAANVFNIGADISAMASSLHLVIGGPEPAYAALFSLASLLIQIFVPYTKYVNVLKWLTVALFSYVATVFVVSVPWETAIRAAVSPVISLSPGYLISFVAALGATINPYLLFWQASQEVEEVKTTPGEEPLKSAPDETPEQSERIQLDTYVGMGFSNVVAYFIILTAAVTLHAQGKHQIQTAAEAAAALRPIAGHFAFLLFGLGIIGSGLMAIPVLAGSAACALGEAMRLRVGLENDPAEAKGFYGLLSAAVLVGMMISFAGINPVLALFWASLINGFIAVPLMIIMMLLGSNRRVMGAAALSLRLRITGWIATAVMLAVAVGSVFLSWI